jgi:lysophospholipid acyltransferase (LPLAT)-like uncharacterized protein
MNKMPDSPAVIAFWHCDMLPVWKLFSNKKVFAVISKNKDGEILSHLLKKWKYNLVRGSSSNGGKEVINKIVNTNDDNAYFLITPDGPKGPKQRCKAGTFVIAQRKQIPLYFVKCEIGWGKKFRKSWDNFILPLFLSKIEIEFSARIDIPMKASRENISQLMNQFSK